MNEIQVLHQKAMEFAEQSEVAKLRGATAVQVQALLREAFVQEYLKPPIASPPYWMPNPPDRSCTEVPQP
jgi:hypothetical protein